MEMVPPLASVMQSRVNPWRFSSLTPDCGALSDAWSVDCFFSWLYPSLMTLVIVSNVLMSGRPTVPSNASAGQRNGGMLHAREALIQTACLMTERKDQHSCRLSMHAGIAQSRIN
jgi:hypothetical protein